MRTPDSTHSSRSSVAVLGLGYVGCVTAACLADLGHDVVGVDHDEFKVRKVLEGSAPFYEPGLTEIIADNIRAGRLSASVSVDEALQSADIVMVCVGTPSERNGNLGLEQLRRVCSQIQDHLPHRSDPLIVAIRSTVFPGTCEEVVLPALGRSSAVTVVSNPEFLREGIAVKDFMDPGLIVVGGDDPAAVRKVAGLYAGLNTQPCLVALRTAEVIKYACNAFHAMKISFANEIGSLCNELGVPGTEVMDTLCRDTKLNVSKAYLKPGFAFGGSCLPKDLRALTYRALRLDLSTPLLDSILPSNEEHIRRAIECVLDLDAEHIGIYGLAFKEETDDLRESPVVTLLEQLVGKGKEVRVYDPRIRVDDIYGSNQRFLLSAVPHIRRLVAGSLDDLLRWSDCLVIAQTPDKRFVQAIEQSRIPALNLAENLISRADRPVAVGV